jgi:hypothetical protein
MYKDDLKQARNFYENKTTSSFEKFITPKKIETDKERFNFSFFGESEKGYYDYYNKSQMKVKKYRLVEYE